MEGEKPKHAVGSKLVVAAPAHSGLPNGANAIVAAARFDASAGTVLYDVTLTGGGAHGRRGGTPIARQLPWLADVCLV